jgi:hypothetical protein
VTLTVIEPPWEIHTPRGKADVLAVIDYSQESYVYFLCAQRVTGDFWVYRNDKCQLFWNESTGLGKREETTQATEGFPSTWSTREIDAWRQGCAYRQKET